MANLVWNNVSDSGANSALSNYLRANQAFRESILGVGGVLSDFTDTLNRGDAENNKRIRAENTQAILNRMNQINSLEDLNKFKESGLGDLNNLRQQYGWFIDGDAINQAQRNLPKDVYERASTLDSTKDYNPDTLKLWQELNVAQANGDTESAQKIFSQLQGKGSLYNTNSRANDLYKLRQDVFDKQLKGIESVAAMTDRVNNAGIAYATANDEEQQKIKQLANILQLKDGEDLVEKMNLLAPEQRDAYLKELQQARLKTAQAQSSLAQAKALQSNIQDMFGIKLPDNSTESTVNELIQRGANVSQNSEVKPSEATQTNQIEQQEPEIDTSKMTPAEYAKFDKEQLQKNTVHKLNRQQTSGDIVGARKFLSIIDGWKDSDLPADEKAFFAGLNQADRDAFAKADVALGGGLTEYLRNNLNKTNRVSLQQSKEAINNSFSNAQSAIAFNIMNEALPEGSGEDTTHILGAGIKAPNSISKKIGDETITITSNTDSNSRKNNAQNLSKLLMPIYQKQGKLDGSRSSMLNLDRFKDRITEAVMNGVDPTVIYNVMEYLSQHYSDSEGEINYSDFTGIVNVLEKEKDNLPSYKYTYDSESKVLKDAQDNSATKLSLINNLIPFAEGELLTSDVIDEAMKHHGIDLNVYTGKKANTQEQNTQVKTALEALRNYSLPDGEYDFEYNRSTSDALKVRAGRQAKIEARLKEALPKALQQQYSYIMRYGTSSQKAQANKYLRIKN